MEMQKRSILLVLLALLLSLALAACGGSTADSEDTAVSSESSSESGEADTAVDSSEASSSEDAVTVEYALWDANQLPAYEQCASDFMALNPNITINITQQGWDDYWNGIQTGMVSGTAPDVFTNHLAKYPEFAAKDQLVDIQPFVERDSVDTSIYLGELADLWGRDGKRFGLPKDWDTIAVVYNKDLLAAAGVTEEELNNATWDAQTGGTFQEILAKLSLDANGNNALSPDFDPENVETYGIAFPYSGGAYGQTQWSMFAVSNGWQFNDGLYDTKYNYEDPKFIETIQWYADMSLVNHVAAPFEDISSLGGDALFVAGDVAMTTQGSWMIGYFSSNAPFEVGFARLPIGPEGRKSMFNGLADSIWTGTEHVEESWQWVKYLASPACLDVVGDFGVVFPSVESGVDKALAAYEERGLDVSAFTEQALEPDGTFLFPVTDHASEITSIMTEAMDAIALGQVTAVDALPAADAEVDGLFK